MTRIATFNVENLFSRPLAMNLPNLADGQPTLNDYAKLTGLLEHETYSEEDKTTILDLLKKYGLDETRPQNEFLELRQIRGSLLQHSHGQTTVKANGRNDWIGWVELKKDAIQEPAIVNTARVIAMVNPEILVMVEVESRAALINFHDQVLKPLLIPLGLPLYEHLMLIHGNDKRSIDVAIMSRKPIFDMRSHVDDCTDSGSLVFSRDCPEYYVQIDDHTRLVLLPNHFASQGSDSSGDRRRIQAEAVKAIYERVRQNNENVIVLGDLNAAPSHAELDPLLKQTDLVDAMSPELGIYHGLPGTYEHATASNKLDYLLLSPHLAQRVTAVDVERHGFYSPKKWECFDNITSQTKDKNQASDHHCVWADLNLDSDSESGR